MSNGYSIYWMFGSCASPLRRNFQGPTMVTKSRRKMPRMTLSGFQQNASMSSFIA